MVSAECNMDGAEQTDEQTAAGNHLPARRQQYTPSGEPSHYPLSGFFWGYANPRQTAPNQAPVAGPRRTVRLGVAVWGGTVQLCWAV